MNIYDFCVSSFDFRSHIALLTKYMTDSSQEIGLVVYGIGDSRSIKSMEYQLYQPARAKLAKTLSKWSTSTANSSKTTYFYPFFFIFTPQHPRSCPPA